jgi:hypothetical protein
MSVLSTLVGCWLALNRCSSRPSISGVRTPSCGLRYSTGSSAAREGVCAASTITALEHNRRAGVTGRSLSVMQAGWPRQR